jgi:hypothetical protein
MSTWEERMAERAKARSLVIHYEDGIPVFLAGFLPDGEPDNLRHWCTSCGLPDVPQNPDRYGLGWPCPRCGSGWQWYGRIADRDGTATGPPEDGICHECYQWRRYPSGQEHFGWAWWRTCDHGCGCAHHADEVWLA